MERYNNTIQESNGDIITTATVTVYLSSTGAVASIFEDDETTSLNNPFTVSDSNYDTDGSFWFKAANGLYDVKINNGSDVWVYDENLLDYNDDQPAINVADSTPINIGNSNDLTASHDGSDSYITNNTGVLYIDSAVNSGVVRIATKNSAGTLKIALLAGAATPDLGAYYDGTKVWKTVSGGTSTLGDNRISGGFLGLGEPEELVLDNNTAGAIAITQSHIEVDTNASASTGELATITGGTTGDIVVIAANDNARTIVVKDGTGNLQLAGDFSLNHSYDQITLIRKGSVLKELSRSDNST